MRRQDEAVRQLTERCNMDSGQVPCGAKCSLWPLQAMLQFKAATTHLVWRPQQHESWLLCKRSSSLPLATRRSRDVDLISHSPLT